MLDTVQKFWDVNSLLLFERQVLRRVEGLKIGKNDELGGGGNNVRIKQSDT
jgi:hypothetical protein